MDYISIHSFIQHLSQDVLIYPKLNGKHLKLLTEKVPIFIKFKILSEGWV